MLNNNLNLAKTMYKSYQPDKLRPLELHDIVTLEIKIQIAIHGGGQMSKYGKILNFCQIETAVMIK